MRGASHRAGNAARQAETGGAEEKSRDGLASNAETRDMTDIGLVYARLFQMLHTRLPAWRDAEMAAQLTVIATMDKAEHCVGRHDLAVIEKAIQSFVDSAVAAHGDDFQMSVRAAHRAPCAPLGWGRW